MVARKRAGATPQLPVADMDDSPIPTDESGTKENKSRGSFVSKQGLMMLTIGILVGYVLLPMALVEVNIAEYLAPDTTEFPSRLRSLDETIDTTEQQIRDQQLLLSRQSMPTRMTPKVMPTKTLSDHERKKILVTGGAGFVGSHLVDKLMMEGHEVTVVDNFFTGQKKNIAHWLQHPNFR